MAPDVQPVDNVTMAPDVHDEDGEPLDDVTMAPSPPTPGARLPAVGPVLQDEVMDIGGEPLEPPEPLSPGIATTTMETHAGPQEPQPPVRVVNFICRDR